MCLFSEPLPEDLLSQPPEFDPFSMVEELPAIAIFGNGTEGEGSSENRMLPSSVTEGMSSENGVLPSSVTEGKSHENRVPPSSETVGVPYNKTEILPSSVIGEGVFSETGVLPSNVTGERISSEIGVPSSECGGALPSSVDKLSPMSTDSALGASVAEMIGSNQDVSEDKDCISEEHEDDMKTSIEQLQLDVDQLVPVEDSGQGQTLRTSDSAIGFMEKDRMSKQESLEYISGSEARNECVLDEENGNPLPDSSQKVTELLSDVKTKESDKSNTDSKIGRQSTKKRNRNRRRNQNKGKLAESPVSKTSVTEQVISGATCDSKEDTIDDTPKVGEDSGPQNPSTPLSEILKSARAELGSLEASLEASIEASKEASIEASIEANTETSSEASIQATTENNIEVSTEETEMKMPYTGVTVDTEKLLSYRKDTRLVRPVSFNDIVKDYDSFMADPEEWVKQRQKVEPAKKRLQKTRSDIAEKKKEYEMLVCEMTKTLGQLRILQKAKEKLPMLPTNEHAESSFEEYIKQNQDIRPESLAVELDIENVEYTQDDLESLLESYEDRIIIRDETFASSAPNADGSSEIKSSDESGETNSSDSGTESESGSECESGNESDSEYESESDEEIENGFIHKGSAIQYRQAGDLGIIPTMDDRTHGSAIQYRHGDNLEDIPNTGDHEQGAGVDEQFYNDYDQSYLFFEKQEKQQTTGHDQGAYPIPHNSYPHQRTGQYYQNQHHDQHTARYYQEPHHDQHTARYYHEAHHNVHDHNTEYYMNRSDLHTPASHRRHKKDNESASQHQRYDSTSNVHDERRASSPPDWRMTAMPPDWMVQYQMASQLQTCYYNYMAHSQWAQYYQNLIKHYTRDSKMAHTYSTQKDYIKQMAKWMARK